MNDNEFFKALQTSFSSSDSIDDILDEVDNSKLVKKLIDWVQYSFTFFERSKIVKLFEILKFDLTEVKKCDYPMGGYKYHYELGPSIKIFIQGEVNKNGEYVNLLQMSGDGCRTFEKRGGNYLELFNFMRINKAKATRIDATHDVLTDRWFTIQKIEDYANAGLFTPKRKIVIINGKSRDGKSEGKTIYFGNIHASDMSICVYEKDKERISKNDYDAVQSDVWIRVELRAKAEHAENFVNEYCLTEGKLEEFITEFLYGNLDFKSANSKDESIRRRETASWWKDFLNFSVKRKISVSNHKTSDLKIKKNWLKTSVSSTLLMLFLADGDGFFEYVKDLILEKASELDNTQLVMINEYLQEKGYIDKLTRDDCEMKLRLLDENKYNMFNKKKD